MDLAHQQLIRAMSENGGHAAITRPVIVGSATATLAARFATLPASTSPRQETAAAAARVGQQRGRAATIIPSTETVLTICASIPTRPIVVSVIHRSAPGHRKPPIVNSPVSTHRLIGAIPLGHSVCELQRPGIWNVDGRRLMPLRD